MPVEFTVAILEVTKMSNRPISYQKYAEDFLMPPLMDKLEQAGIKATRFSSDLLSTEEVLHITNVFDAFIIMGGEDVHPSFYAGGIGYTDEGPHFPAADANQIAIVLESLKLGKKIFGICRGLQIINIALGGNITQHIEDGSLHRQPTVEGEPRQARFHSVAINENTLTHKFYGSSVEALTSHHQAVNVLGSGLEVTAYAPDGIIEAVEHESGFIIGVQFHPEHKTYSEELIPPIINFLRS